MRARVSRRRFVSAGTGLVGAALLAACAAPAPPTPAPAKPADAPKPGPAEQSSAPPPKPAAADAAKPTEAARPAATQAPPAAATKPAPTSEAQALSQILTFSTNAAPPHFNPLTAVSATQGFTFNSIMSTLVMSDADKLDFAPDLAEKWEVAPDASSYTFFLRKNAKWHDGRPVTTKDVSYTYHMVLNKETGAKTIGRFSGIKGAADYTGGRAEKVAGIATVDPYTIRFDLDSPNAVFMYAVRALSILPEHILGSVPPAELGRHRFFSESPIGSGPFKFVKYLADQRIELAANPDYHFGRPKLDQIIFQILKSPDTTEVAMEREEVDIPIFDGGTATSEMFSKFVKDPRFKVVGAQGFSDASYAFNYRHEYLKDSRVHQAVAYALNRKQLIAKFQPAGRITNSQLIHPWYQKPAWAELYPYDPAKAKALLQEAGWDSKREVGVNVITLGNEEVKAMVAAEQQMLADVGFKIQFKEMDLPTWVTKFYDAHDFEMVRVSFGAGFDPHDHLSYQLSSKGGPNALGYAHPELDKPIDEGVRSADQKRRIEIYQQINEELLKAMPIVPIYGLNRWWIINRRVSIPYFDKLPPPTDLSNVPVAQIHIDNAYWQFHQEQWAIKRTAG